MTGPTVPSPPVSTAPVSRLTASRPAVTGVRTALAAAAAASSGMVAAWLAAGGIGVLAGMAVLLAAGNGYAKAYSP
jgi:hypothetical protein